MSRHTPLTTRCASSQKGMKLISAAAARAIAPVAIALVGSLWLAGCDTPANQEDRKVQADIQTAQAAIDVAGSPGATDDQRRAAVQAVKTLEQSASDASLTPVTRAAAKSNLAQVEQNAASITMQQIDVDDAKLNQLVWEISRLTQLVDASRALAAGYDKYDPKPTQDAIAAAVAAAQGGPAAPNLSALAQTISQLQGQIAKQTDDLKSLQDQRTQVLDEADQADKSSELSKGQQSVDDFKRAADLHKQAGILTVQIEKNQAQAVPLQKDLEVAQAQQTNLQALIKELGDQSQAVDAGWKSVQEAVASQAVLQKQIVAGITDAATAAPTPAAPAPATPDAGPAGAATPAGTGTPVAAPAMSLISPTAGKSIGDKAAALQQLVQTLAQERSEALSNLNNAIQHYRDAASAGQEYFAILDPKIKDPANVQRPELNAWKNLQDVTNPAVYKMQEALAQRQLAGLYVAEVANDSRRATLQDEVAKVLGQANIPVPAALSDAGLEDDKKSAATSAVDAFAKADETITGLTHGLVPDPLPKLARVQHLLTLYGQVQLARAMGDSTTAQDKLTALMTERDDAIRDGLTLPSLPAEIAPPPGPPPAAPAAAPAT